MKVTNITHILEYQIAQKINDYVTPFISFSGIFGNVVTIIVLVTSSLRKTTTCWYMTAIAVLDIIILLFEFVWLFIRPRVIPSYFDGWTCRVMYTIFFFAIHYNVLLLVAMTIERYIAVRFPIRAQNLLTRKRTVLIMIILGCVSFGINVIHIFARKSSVDTATGKIECIATHNYEMFINFVWPWIDATFYCFIPLVLLVLFNILIVKQLRQAGRRQRELIGNCVIKYGAQFAINQSQVTLMLLLVSVSFVVLVTPIAILVLYEGYGWESPTDHDKAVHELFRTLTGALMFINHSLNFVLYCLSGRRFRAASKSLFCCYRMRYSRLDKGKVAYKNTISLSTKSDNKSSTIATANSISDEDAVSIPVNAHAEDF